MTTSSRIYKIAIVAPTCFYYQSALFRDLANDSRINLKIYFCSDEGLTGQDISRLHGTQDSWGIGQEILQGFDYVFLKNYSPIGSYLKRFGLFNASIWRYLHKDRPDAVVLMAWNNPTFWVAMLTCILHRIPFFFMTDANLEVELAKGSWQTRLKGALLGNTLFKMASGFLCAGSANQRLFTHWGVPGRKLIPFAYSWGYQSFLRVATELSSKRSQLRATWGIPEDSNVVLYCGRLSHEKNLFNLLEAYRQVKLSNKSLIIVGDGELNKPLRKKVAEYQLDSVLFVGFQNRKEINQFYAMSDVLVLPSIRETWGIVVNEAMCFSLPIIVSQRVGAGEDLVEHGYNGFRFNHEDPTELSGYIESVMKLSATEKQEFGTRSRNRIEQWLNRDLAVPLLDYLDTALAAQTRNAPNE